MRNEYIFFLHLFVVALPLLWIYEKKLYSALPFLCGIAAFCANCFVMKEVCLFGMHATCVEPWAVLLYVAGNMVHEEHGARAAFRLGVHTFFVFLWLLAGYGCLLWYVPAAHDTMHSVYEVLGLHLGKAVVLSLIVSFCAYVIERLIYAGLRSVRVGISFSATVAFLCSQCADTTLFACGFFDRPVGHIAQLVLFSMIIKTAVFFCLQGLLAYACKRSPSNRPF